MDRLSANSILIIFFLFFSSPILSEEIRDYYAEPGLHPFKDSLSDLNESIDPFSGTLQHKYVDMLIPGNGGLDIAINRVYTSLQDSTTYDYRNYTGLGWTMHMGRIVVPTTRFTRICSQQSFSVSTKDNPSIEFPDGGRELLVLKDINVDETLITKSNWKADCQGVTQGMRVTAPDGKKYYMDVDEFNRNHYSWYTSKIVDLDGNTININYGTASGGTRYISSISASDGRSVAFNYVDTGSNATRLTSISANGQTVRYDYTPVVSGELGAQHLNKVTRPDGLSWEYTYYPDAGIGVAGGHSMKSVKYPHGARINYTYQLVRFEPTNPFETTSVETKDTSGAGVDSGTWEFIFSPSIGQGEYDHTTVNTPDGSIVYSHYGYRTGGSLVWPIGLLVYKKQFSGGSKIEEIANQWGSRNLSTENYWHGRDKVDVGTKAPVLEWSYHWKDVSGLLTTYSEHDEYGNPRKIEEECDLSNCSDRVTNITYKNDTLRWVLGLPTNSTINDIGTTTNSYTTSGRLKEINQYGVITAYDYTGQGDVRQETNANTIPATYDDYRRGIAQTETRQVSSTKTITVQRSINSTGTVASITDGRGITTSFTYDSMNRLESIDYPIKDDVTITYGSRSEVLTRGDYQQTKSLNGFGNVTSFERKDLANNVTITTTNEYDEFGRKTFQSYPNSTLGVTTEYDTLGRETKITHGNGEFRTIEYGLFTDGGSYFLGNIKTTDERGNISYRAHLYYGNFGRSQGITHDRTDETFTYTKRDALGAVLEVIQGRPGAGVIEDALVRTYTYDSRRYLETITNPETGVTVFGRDAVGNKISSLVGSSPVTQYVYDDINRLTNVDYPDGTEDTAFVYDDNSNLKQSQKGAFTWDYDYDLNDNLELEKLTIAGVPPRSFTVDYDYT